MQELLAAQAWAQRSQVRKTQAPAILETKPPKGHKIRLYYLPTT